jgi:hypothetical protein
MPPEAWTWYSGTPPPMPPKPGPGNPVPGPAFQTRVPQYHTAVGSLGNTRMMTYSGVRGRRPCRHIQAAAAQINVSSAFPFPRASRSIGSVTLTSILSRQGYGRKRQFSGIYDLQHSAILTWLLGRYRCLRFGVNGFGIRRLRHGHRRRSCQFRIIAFLGHPAG